MRIFLFILLFSLTNLAVAGWGHKPPGQPEAGYGSTENYITDGWQLYQQGSQQAGDLTWLYVPDKLRYGDQAPVVVYLHGFAVLTPDLYRSHIEHIVRQGNIVVFPLFQKSTFWGFLSESGLFKPVDQSLWAQRAVRSVDDALAPFADQIAWDEVYLYGHSLGGLIALAWQAEGGIPLKYMVLSHAQVDTSAGMPDFVQKLVKIVEIPWREYALDIDIPVLILNGEEDTIALPSQSEEIFSRLTGGSLGAVSFCPNGSLWIP